MNIGIYGGSFNPPHIAHLIVAESIRDQFDLDQILWIPSYIPPHKTHLKLADASHRLAMTKLATAGNPAFRVSSLEIDRQGTSFTVDTLRTLTTTNPQDTFYLLIGEDSLREFMTWQDPALIVKMVELLVYRRNEKIDRRKNGNYEDAKPALSEAEMRFPSRIRFAEAPMIDISSEAIRANLQAGNSIRHLVPDTVYDYIFEHGLY